MDMFNEFNEFLKKINFDLNFEDNIFPSNDDSRFNKTVTEVETDKYNIITETWLSLNGSSVYKKTIYKSKNNSMDIDIDVLKKQLNKAIEDENFELAAKLRDKIKSIKKAS